MIDLPDSGSDGPLEVIERTVDPEVMKLVVRLAPAVRLSLDAMPVRRRDCGYACSAWKSELERQGIVVQIEGGVGEDDDAPAADYKLIPLDLRSGYREDDGHIHRHWWLRVGSGRSLFDPTAHQFDDRGGVDVARYVLDGGPILPEGGPPPPRDPCQMPSPTSQ